MANSKDKIALRTSALICKMSEPTFLFLNNFYNISYLGLFFDLC